MKRDRINEANPFDAASKKIHFPTEVKGSKERIYRCTFPSCNFIACTPHNVMHHAKTKHSINNENMIE